MITQYEVFELMIGRKNGEVYPITVKKSPSGNAEAISKLNPSSPTIQDIIFDLKKC